MGGSKKSPQRRAKKRGNGQGTVYKLPNGKYKAEVVLAHYNVKDDDGKTHLRKKIRTKTCDKAKDAAAAIPELIKGAQGYKAQNDMTVYALREAYIKSQKYLKLSSGQQDKLGYAWNRWKPLWYRKINDLLVDDLQDTIDALKLTYYPARDMKVMMSHIYETAMRRELVTWNKTECIDLPESPKAKKEIFTEEEKQALWNDYEGRDKDGNIHREYSGARIHAVR